MKAFQEITHNFQSIPQQNASEIKENLKKLLGIM